MDNTMDNIDPAARRDKTQLDQGVVEISVSPVNDGHPDPFSVSAILSKSICLVS